MIGPFRRRKRLDAPAAFAEPVTSSDLLWALGSLCNLHRLPFDPALAQSQHPPPHTTATVVDAAHRAGFEGRAVCIDAAGVAALPHPCIVLLRREPDEAGTHPLGMVARIEGARVLFFRAGTNIPAVVPLEQFEQRFAGVALALRPSQQAIMDTDAAGTPPRFDFRWFVPELLKHRRIWRDVLLASLFIQLIALAVPLCSQIIIDKVIVHQTTSTLAVIATALLMLLAFSSALSWVRQYLVSHTGNRVDAVLGMAIFRHLFQLPVRFFEHRPTGVVAARLHGVETIREFLSGAAVTLLLDCPFLLIFLALMFVYSVWLTLLALAVIFCIVVMSAAVAPVFQARLNQQFLLGARNQAFLTEYIAGMETVKALQMEPQLNRRYEEYLAAYLQSNFGTRQLANTYNTTANGLEQLMSTAILCLGAWLVMRGADFTIGMLVAFQMFATRVSQPMLRMVGLWQQLQQARIAVRRLADIMDAPAEPYATVPSREPAGSGHIAFTAVGYRYRDDLPLLLRGLSFTILPGQCVVVLGPSGSGKSTLAKLLQGFQFPCEGTITIDGRDTRHLSSNELRAYFGVVPQETTLFSGTVYDNLMLANAFATFDQVVRACKLAEIHDTIAALPEGYQTRIGERGVGLSGGQKQRIAIARALLKRPRMLVFDEATSNLDQPTAEQLARTIAGLRGKVTILFIAHSIPKGLTADAAIRIGPPSAVPATATSG
jgi:subfamily B ATP-binding cassette protein HlyB/CyaB